jgi:hypothetical protein
MGNFRRAYVSFAVLAGALVAMMTEALSALQALTQTGAVIVVMMIAGIALVMFRREARFSWNHSWTDVGLIGGTAGILGIIAFTAILSPPNSADAMAYHMPRIVYWTQQRSVAPFATPYLNQVMLQPFAEYFMLHSYLLTGGDRFVNLVQWFGCATSVIGVSLIAAQFGAGRRGQILAAVFCATLPNGILQASGAKNDYVLAAWLVAAVFFLGEGVSPILAGCALGLAFGTKATAYLFAPPLITAILILRPWSLRSLGIVTMCALGLNLPQFFRNIDLSESVLGFDSAHGDGRFRWRNETFGWRETASNLIRNSTEQLGGPGEGWNQWLYTAAVSLHQHIGMNVDNPNTTWLWAAYHAPRNTNHEADAGNRWHLLILTLSFALLPWRSRRLLLYASSLIAAFVLFALYLKWQPFMARLFLPLFVLASPIAGIPGEKIRPPIVQIALCLFLFNNARPYLFENWVRPLKGPHSLLHSSRDADYFSDMSQWNNRETYFRAVEEVERLNCSLLGIDINDLQLEYPIQALLTKWNPSIQFMHTAVSNPSAKYARPGRPCAVLCLDCEGDETRIARYRDFGALQRIDKFLLFSK